MSGKRRSLIWVPLINEWSELGGLGPGYEDTYRTDSKGRKYRRRYTHREIEELWKRCRAQTNRLNKV